MPYFQPYQFHPQLVVRAPRWPFDAHIRAEQLAGLLDDPVFREALYLASPVLWQECDKWRRGEITDTRRLDKLRKSLTRYYLRATSRCTPFGLFAGCGLARWGASSHLALDPARHARHTRLDMHYLCALAQHLAGLDAVRPRLRYRPSSSLHRAGEAFRYVEYLYTDGRRVNQLSAVEASPAVTQTLEAAQHGATYPELLRQLTAATGASPEEAAAFIDELARAQVLVHELEPTVTGPEFFDHLLRVFQRLLAEAPGPDLAALLDRLTQVQAALHALDAAPANEPARYEAIAALLEPLGVPVEAGKLFQTDAALSITPQSTVAEDVQTELLAALRVAALLTPEAPATRLTDFQRRFEARYEQQEVPLLAALDTESGLYYADYGRSVYVPLVHDIVTPVAAATSPSARAFPADELLTRRLRQAQQTRQYEVELTAADVAALPPPPQPLPPSLSVMFRLLDQRLIQLESVGGSSAVNLLGRFAHAAPAIGELVRAVTAHEQTQNPAVDFAEVCHLPDSRAGNVLLRPSFRALEIPYLAQAAVPPAQQIPVQDLTLAVRNGRFVLRSRRTGRPVVPRLSTAHNYSHDALPVYQFLCDLQTQGVQPYLEARWPGQPAFAPRLRTGRVVLAPAAWHLEAADLAALLAASEAALPAALAAFRRQWQLPRWFVLAEGDNELLVDADNPWLVQVWLEAVRGQARVHLKEFLFDAAQSPAHSPAGPHTQQLLALLLREGPVYAALPAPAPADAVRREFGLGSEWLYYKLYCGQQQADSVLLDAVQPLTETLQAQELIDQWFFIRYADPEPHLRLRLHLPDVACLGEVVQLVAAQLQPWQAAGIVWRVQTDQYQRELERYGPHLIELTEQLFHWQSEALLRHLAAATEPDAYWAGALATADELLAAFAYPLAQRLALTTGLREAFFREFNGDKPLRRQLDAKYRQLRPVLADCLPAEPVVPPELAALAARINAQREAGQPEPPGLMGAYLHMLLNRYLPAEPRLHELVLYDFLSRHYQGQLARQQ